MPKKPSKLRKDIIKPRLTSVKNKITRKIKVRVKVVEEKQNISRKGLQKIQMIPCVLMMIFSVLRKVQIKLEKNMSGQ